MLHLSIVVSFPDIETAVPGVAYSEHMVQLAASLGDYAMIRSIRHDQGESRAGNHYMTTGCPAAYLWAAART